MSVEVSDLMWQIQNSQHVMFSPTRNGLEEIRQQHAELKHGRISNIIQLNPSGVKFYVIYLRGSRNPEQDAVVKRLEQTTS